MKEADNHPANQDNQLGQVLPFKLRPGQLTAETRASLEDTRNSAEELRRQLETNIDEMTAELAKVNSVWLFADFTLRIDRNRSNPGAIRQLQSRYQKWLAENPISDDELQSLWSDAFEADQET